MSHPRITVYQKPTCTTCRLFITAHPDLLQRSIVERGDRAVLARPPERVREIL